MSVLQILPLFPLGGTMVSIDLGGAVSPLALSLAGLVYSLLHSDPSTRLRTIAWSAVLVVAIGLVSVAMNTMWGVFYGGIGLSPLLLYALGFVAAFAYFSLMGRKKRWTTGVRESYVIGTFSMLLNDLVRTLAGLFIVSWIIWGASGPGDAVFFFGVITLLLYLSFSSPRLPAVVYASLAFSLLFICGAT